MPEFESVTTKAELEIANQITQFRASKGLAAIHLSSSLSSACRYKAARMQAGEGSEIKSDNRPPLTRAQIVGGYTGEDVKEWIACGTVHATELATKITGGASFLLYSREERFNEIGIGVAGSAFGLFCVVNLGARVGAPIPIELEPPPFPEQIPADLMLYGPALWLAPQH
ncbi:MAG TPA: hypothetical protein VGX68_29470 [Thermoanaerobaculia bacterium]|jgi:hypothetical protein|nr:hypothetical protein [Thermoanaerobaculia bacterium]